MNRILLLLPALAACAVTVPPHTEPALHDPPPGQWRAGADPSEPVADWWTTFGDEQLDALIGEAIARNHDLRAAAARLEAAAALARIAGAERLPDLQATFDASRQRQNFIGLPIPGAGVLSRTFNTFGVGLNSFWEVDLWGRVRAGESAAHADFEAEAHDLRAAHQSLAAQTARAWLAVLEARLQLELTEATAVSHDATLSQVRDRFTRGTRSALDVRLAASNAEATRALLALRDEQLARATRQLELLVGRYPEGALAAVTDLPGLPGRAPAGLPAELLRRRPDVLAAERRLAAQDQRVAQAVAAKYPRIALTASAGTASPELHDVVDPDFFVWSLLGNITAPIFQNGRLTNEVELQEARSKELVANYAATAQRAFLEVETALAVEDRIAARERHLAAAASEAATARVQSEQRYRDGLEDLVTVLEAQRRALETQSQHIVARRVALDNRIDLHLALGGGFAGELQQ